MQNWQKQRNYRKTENPDGSFTYVITVDGVDVKVSADVYTAYSKGGRKMEYMEYDLKRDRVLQDTNGRWIRDADGIPLALPEREISLDKLMDEDWDFVSPVPDPEDVVIRQIEITAVRQSMELLPDADRALIHALFFEGKTERQYGAETGVHFMTVHSRKVRALGRLKKLLAGK